MFKHFSVSYPYQIYSYTKLKALDLNLSGKVRKHFPMVLKMVAVTYVDRLHAVLYHLVLNVKYYDHYLILMSCFYKKKTLKQFMEVAKENEHNKNYLISKYLSRNVCYNLRYIIEIQFVG